MANDPAELVIKIAAQAGSMREKMADLHFLSGLGFYPIWAKVFADEVVIGELVEKFLKLYQPLRYSFLQKRT